jgi:hypothetical protein
MVIDGRTDLGRRVADLAHAFAQKLGGWSSQRSYAAFGITRIQGDRYAGEWPRERFRALGIHYDPCEKPKSQLYVDLLPLLNAGRAELLDHARLAAQLCGLERRTARGGRDSIDHAPGGHDDIANCVAGALTLAAASGARRIVITPAMLRWAAIPACPAAFLQPGYRARLRY